MKKAPLVCVLCRHWEFFPGSPHYSSLTPGSNWFSACEKGHWDVDGDDVTTEEWRKTLLTASTCPDFEAVQEPDKD